MSVASWTQLAVLVAVVAVLAPPLGGYNRTGPRTSCADGFRVFVGSWCELCGAPHGSVVVDHGHRDDGARGGVKIDAPGVLVD